MSIEQVRTEINQILQKLPEENLIIVLEYLQEVHKLTGEKVKLVNELNVILREDKDLLARLAQ